MKGKISLTICAFFFLTFCANSVKEAQTERLIVLTQLNAYMAYAQVCEMVNSPEQYHGVKVKANGIYTYLNVDR